MDTIQINNISIEEFKEIIKNSIDQIRLDIPVSKPNDSKKVYATRKEVASALHISLPTLYELTKTGILTGYKVRGRVLFRWEDVDKALIPIETLKYKRGQ